MHLVLEDGTIFSGLSFGAQTTAYGEVVFNTSMAGYQEMLTDPSYAGQILVLTYPLIGNYGTNAFDDESAKVHALGLVVHEYCQQPSNYLCNADLSTYLKQKNVPALSNIDTRALTKKLRQKGVMMGVLTNEMTPQEALLSLQKEVSYNQINFLNEAGSTQKETFQAENEKYRLALVDCGVKRGTIHMLNKLGATIIIYKHTATADEILSTKADGVLLSSGPSDPAQLDYLVETVKTIIDRQIPLMGVGLGHQIIGRAFGLQTFKLKFGHRGSNHPVQDTENKKVYISTQNHGYAVCGDNMPENLKISFISLNDQTIEGFKHQTLPIMSIQFCAKDTSGPIYSGYMFREFLTIIDQYKNK